MDWIDAVNLFFKLKDYNEHYKNMKELHGYSKKLNPKKMDWDSIKYYQNDQMKEATATFRKALKAAESALKGRLIWPRPDERNTFADALKAATRYGAGSRQAKAALADYRAALVSFDRRLSEIVGNLRKLQPVIAEREEAAIAVAKYCRVLEDAFMTVAKIPSGPSTAQQAQFFSLSRDALQLAIVCEGLAKALGRIRDRNDRYIAEGQDLIKQNAVWLKWATSDVANDPAVLRKNVKAARPRR